MRDRGNLVGPKRKWDDNNKMNLQQMGSGAWTGLIWLRIETDCVLCECDNEPWCSIKCCEILD
jgi:hypothetical protein